MDRKLLMYSNMIFFSMGTLIIAFMTFVTAGNFIKDARIFDKPAAPVAKVEPVKPIPRKEAIDIVIPSKVDNTGQKGKSTGKPSDKSAISVAKPVPETSKIKVEVINYSGIKKLADEIREVLEANGFEVSSGNGKSNKFISSAIIERNDKKVGNQVQKVFKFARVTKDIDPNSRFDVTLIIGDDYKP